MSCLMLLLSGCAHHPVSKLAPITELTSGVAQKNQTLKNLTHWTAEGKLAASNQSDVIQAAFTWEQMGPIYKIKFYGPLGIHAGYLKGNTHTHQVIFQDAKGKIHKASSAEKLVYEATGITFPLNDLRYWIKGLAHPHHSVQRSIYNRAGLLTDLKQDNWDISYAHYLEHRQIKGLFLPGMIKIDHQKMHLKLIIYSWVN